MYKKILMLKALAISLCFFSSLQAVEILPEARAAYFYPTDDRFRDVYSDAGLYSIETSVQAWKQLYPWASVGFLYTSGSSVGEGSKTRLYMIPIGVGLKYLFDFDRLQPYLGLGVVGAYANIHNDSSFVARRQSDWGVGGIAKTGCLAYVTQNLFLDIFLDYTYLKINFGNSKKNVLTRRADLSGLSVGGGIGYRF